VSRAHRAADGVVGGVAVDQTVVVCSVVVWHGDMHTGATYLWDMGHGRIHGRSGGRNTGTTYSLGVESLLSDYMYMTWPELTT
jgi:hypothetical protein